MANQELLGLLTKVSYYNGKLEAIDKHSDGYEKYQASGLAAKDNGFLKTVSTEVQKFNNEKVAQTQKENLDTINTYFYIGLVAKLEELLKNPKSYSEVKEYAEAKLSDLKRNDDLRKMICFQLGLANDETLDSQIDELISEIEAQTKDLQRTISEKQGFADSAYIPGEIDGYSDVFNPDFDRRQELNDLLSLDETPSIKGRI